MEIRSDQDALQMYSCTQQKGTMSLKKTQGLFDTPGRPRIVEKYGCIVLEVQDWIDAINQPQWGRENKQVYSPGEPYVLRARYDFSVKK